MESGGLITEVGGLITEVGWTEFDFLSHGEESEAMMAQLLGAFPSHGEEGQHELLHWPDQVSNAYSDSIPPACGGYYFLSNSNEALGSSSCTAPDALGSSVQEEHGAAEYLNVTANRSFNCFGNGDPSSEDLDPMSVSMVSAVGAAANKSKRKHMVEEHDGQTQTKGRKCSRNVGEAKRAKKAKKSGDEDSSIAVPNGSPTSCCTSDSDSNASLESADADANARRLKGKGRVGRGVTTEPQSIYARKRRERINGRLKILQNLVPNGTKVDISTMLEEAVHYVKFLQLQIRLLSSDDTWMYAPIAYNGMNLGIDLNMDR